MGEPTSSLTFRDLLIETCHKLGTAEYKDGGTGEITVPSDPHDLAEAKRLVNNAIRMFIHNAPPGGWRWLRPVASITVWGDIATDSDNTVSATDYSGGKTTLVAEMESFYPTMELKTITITGIGSFTIVEYKSATTIVVDGDASATSEATWSITADGNYTLPRDFGGQVNGAITYTSNTNQNLSLGWNTEAHIRQLRENVSQETGDPYMAAVRVMGTGSPRRRWELMLYPMPDELMVVEFPYTLHFDKLVELDETPPCPLAHDESLRAACRATAERDVDGVPGSDTEYFFQRALPDSYRVDAMSAPRRLGYFGNRGKDGPKNLRDFRDNWEQRPPVQVN